MIVTAVNETKQIRIKDSMRNCKAEAHSVQYFVGLAADPTCWAVLLFHHFRDAKCNKDGPRKVWRNFGLRGELGSV